MSGDGAAARFDEMRAVTHQLAAEVGADDRQVLLNQEVIGAAQAVEQGNLDRVNAITGGKASAPMDNRPFAIVISAAELVSRDDAEGALILLMETEIRRRKAHGDNVKQW